MQFEYSGFWLLLLAALSASASYYFYRTDRSIAQAPRAIRSLLAVLRAVLLFAVSAMCIGPFVQLDRSQMLKPIVLVLQDNSRSVPAVSSDSLFMRNEYPVRLSALSDKISETYELRSYSFGTGVSKMDSLSYDESETDYDVLFDQIQQLYGDENIGSVILATDGNHTRGEALAYSARRLQTAAPFYVIALGDTVRRADLFLTDLRFNEKGYVNKISQIAVTVGWQGIAENATVLRLYAGDSLVGEKKLLLNSRQGSLSELFSFIPLKPGNYKMRVVADRPLSDRLPANNSLVFYLSVHESRKKIVFYNKFLSPDAGAFYRALSSNTNYEVTQLRQLGDKSLDKCDLLVLSGADTQNTLRNDLQKRGIPLLWLRGMDDIRRGGYVTGLDISGAATAPDQVTLTANKQFKLFGIDDDIAALSRRAMPIFVPYGKYSMPDVLLQTAAFQQIKGIDTDRPLVTVYRKDAFKQVHLLGSGYWNWRVQCYRDNENFVLFDHFANTLSEYLLANSGKERFTVNSPRSASENENIRITAHVLDASQQLTGAADVALRLTDSAGSASTFDFVSIGDEYSLSLGRMHPGEYRFAATAKLGSETFAQSGTIRIAESSAELVSSSADLAALRMLTDEHEGSLFFPNTMSSIADSIAAHPARPVYAPSTEYIELIDISWILAVLVTLLFAEWIVRKYYGGF